MSHNRSIPRLFLQLSQGFQVRAEIYPNADVLLRAQLALGFLLFYGIAWSSYVLLYFSLGNVLSALSCALFGLPSSLAGLYILRRFHNPQWAALIANFGGTLVLLGIIISTGASASPIYAWFFFVTITAFLLNGKKAGYVLALTTSGASGAVVALDMLGLAFPNGFGFAVGSNLHKFFVAYTYASAILSLAVVAHIYDGLVVKSMREATEARDRTHDQFQTVANLLNNMGQAVFVIDGNGRIKPPVSLFSETIFGRRIENALVSETLFKDIPKHSEAGARITSVLSLAIGSDALQWSTLEGLLPTEVDYALGMQRKTLRCVYRPLYDAQMNISGIMCVIEDISALLLAQKDLQKVREENQKTTLILEHIVRHGPDAFDGFLRHTANHVQVFYDAMGLVDKDRRFIIDICLRSVHTIKGNARQVGLGELASRVHDIEHDIVEFLRRHAQGERGSLQLIAGLMLQTRPLVTELRDYERVLVHFFKTPSTFHAAFQAMLHQGLEHCRQVSQAWNKTLWTFHCFFVAECLRFFEVPELVIQWEQFAQLAERFLAHGQKEEWSRIWEPMVKQIKTHEGIRSKKNPRDNSGTLQIAARNVDRIRSHIQLVEDAKDQEAVRCGLVELRLLLNRLDEVQLDVVMKNFQPMVDELGQRFGKKARLLVDTGMTSLDRDAVDILNDALMHIVRNMMDHGLERPEQRMRLGKDEGGTIRMQATEKLGQIEILISDDGAGIDTEKLIQKAQERGLVKTDARVTPSEAIQLIFLPNLSTKDVETEISGRGFGMEAAQAAVNELGGRILVETERDRGTRFIITIPITGRMSHAS